MENNKHKAFIVFKPVSLEEFKELYPDPEIEIQQGDLTMENNEIFASLEEMLKYLESGLVGEYEKEKKHYEELKAKRKTHDAHPFRDILNLTRRSVDDKIPL